MTTRKLQEIYKHYSEGKITNGQAQKQLWDVLFRRRGKILPNWMKEDNLQEFMVFIKQKFPNVLENYDAKMAVFSTFFFGVVSIARRWWYNKNIIKVSKDACCNALLEEGVLAEQPEDAPENAIYIKNEQFCDEKNWVYKGKSDKKRQIRRDICLVLAIKSCMYIDDDMIEKVAFETGVSTERLQQMILKAKESMKKKIERVESLILRRNFAYFRRKYILIKKADKDRSYYGTFFDEKLKMYDRKWKAAVDLIAKQHMTPTNDAVGEILSMSPRRVSFLVDKAKELLAPDGGIKEDGKLL